MELSSNRISNQRQNMARQNNGQVRAGQSQMARPTSSLSDYGQAKRPSALAEGQLIRGEVTDLRNNEIEITLEDNTVFAAHLEEGAALSIGDTSAFRVTSVAGGEITVRAIPKTELLQEMSMIYKALEEAGLPKNDKNIEIVRSLMKEGLPINQQAIMNSMRLQAKNPEIPIGTLLQLEKYGIPATENNVASFEALKNGAFSMDEKLIQIADTMEDFLMEGNISTGRELADFLSLITPGHTDFPMAEMQMGIQSGAQSELVFFLSEKEQQDFLDILSNFQETDEIQEQLNQGTMSLREAMHIVLDCMDQAMEIDEKNAMSAQEDFDVLTNAKGTESEETENAEKLSEGREAFEDDQMTTQKRGSIFRDFFNRLTGAGKDVQGESNGFDKNDSLDIPKTIDLFDHPVIKKLFEHYRAEQEDKGSLFHMMSPEELKILGNEMSKLFPDSLRNAQILGHVKHGDISIDELLEHLKEQLRSSELSGEHVNVDDFVKHPMVGKLVRQAFLLSTTLSPNEMALKENLSEIFKETYVRMEQLEQFARTHDNGSSLSASLLSEQTLQAKADISFLNSMEEMFRYIQIPLRRNQQNAQAELYVYTRKDALLEHPERLSVLLHLDMDNLGPLDIHLSMNYNRVDAVFYLDEEEDNKNAKKKKFVSTRQILSEHMNTLSTALEEKGFLLQHRIEQSNRLKPKESGTFEYVLREQIPGGAKKRYSFDIRA